MISAADTILDIINQEIAGLQFDASPKTLFDPISYILSLGGKRIRPVLTIMSCEMFGGNAKDAMATALAIEVFHNFTLLHDDLMDKADIRRGKATVHKKWNDNTAVLSGDAMLIESYHLIAKNKKKHLKELLQLFSKTATEICGGQQLDMEFESRENVTEGEYIEMIRLKTAVLLGCSLKCGAIIAEASDKDADLLYNFGINLGLAFQLKDDLLDVYGDSKKFGKNIGGDIVSNKKTFLLIHALEAEETRDEILSWIRNNNFVRKEKIKAVTAIFNRLKLRELSEARIEDYYQRAVSCLEQVDVSDKKKKVLYEIASGLSSRKS